MWEQVRVRLRRTSPPRWPTVVSWLLASGCALAATIRVFGLDHGALLVQLTAFVPYLALGSLIAALVAGVSRAGR